MVPPGRFLLPAVFNMFNLNLSSKLGLRYSAYCLSLASCAIYNTNRLGRLVHNHLVGNASGCIGSEFAFMVSNTTGGLLDYNSKICIVRPTTARPRWGQLRC